MKNEEMIRRISELKKEKNAVVLAHNYARAEVQDIADLVGDSFALSRAAVDLDADMIVFAGVHFMAESAYILSPQKTILLPDADAGCPMADMVTADALREAKKQHPNAAVVCYVNSSAAVKAESDVCCTSANAKEVAAAIKEDEILFVPDKNLGHYISTLTEKKVHLWNGFCPIHQQITEFDVLTAKSMHPNAVFLAHPECRAEVLKHADGIFSTAGIIKYAAASDEKEFIIGTEQEMMHKLRQDSPEKSFYPVSKYAYCANMKMATLPSILNALETETTKITVPEKVRINAKKALDRMLDAVPK
ncbi:Quinolinate synthase A [Methanimicrococcus sp. At1]|uniref:Quinolinate synthase n=1 Tax=Methanimicrococcus hacksteinii TaxID=3028293 RepID=A0ABU3VRZ4_9EURY|nr:quinolinate synthase NadA [Methanimicrococcus sp. At1]MDV0446172.1 Quinolinate synthase A [Methanimicrococcus sp. At1]